MNSQGEFDKRQARDILHNQFKYSLRESQTPLNLIKQVNVSTVKPVYKDLNKCVNQAWIYDVYEQYFLEKKREQHEKETKNQKSHHIHVSDEEDEVKTSSTDYIYTNSFKRCLKIMERMVVQNNQPKMYHNYKYLFTDENTEVNTGKESFMVHLWKFYYAATKKKAVTSLCWNPKYPDLFAVGFGTYDFGGSKSVGHICLCSLKNNMSPEMTFQTSDNVMCLDWHPHSPSLLAVGLYNGAVQVFDIRDKNKLPIYSSSVKTNKHTDPVWQVKWNHDISKHLNFYSISSDGRVMNWILMKDKLEPEVVIRLKLINKSSQLINLRKCSGQ